MKKLYSALFGQACYTDFPKVPQVSRPGLGLVANLQWFRGLGIISLACLAKGLDPFNTIFGHVGLHTRRVLLKNIRSATVRKR